MNDVSVRSLPLCAADVIGFFEGIKMNDLEGKWLRISKAVQVRHFGRAVFGNKAVKVTEDGKVITYHTTGFGRDWEEQTFRFDHAAGQFRYASGLDAALPREMATV